MKLPISLCVIFLSIAAVVLAEITPINIDVSNKVTVKGNAPRPGDSSSERNQTHQIFVKLMSSSKQPLTDVVVKYWFISKDMGGNALRVFKEGEIKTTLDRPGTKIVSTEPVTTTYTEAGTRFVQDQQAQGQQRVNAIRVAASGQKLVGYAVRVFSDGKLMREYYSESSYKQKLGGNPPTR